MAPPCCAEQPQPGRVNPCLSPSPPTHPTTDNWGFSQLGNNPMGPSPNALKYQVIGTLHAAAYMRGASSRFLLPCLALLVGSYRFPCECAVSCAAAVGLAEAAGLLACPRLSSLCAAAVALLLLWLVLSTKSADPLCPSLLSLLPPLSAVLACSAAHSDKHASCPCEAAVWMTPAQRLAWRHINQRSWQRANSRRQPTSIHWVARPFVLLESTQFGPHAPCPPPSTATQLLLPCAIASLCCFDPLAAHSTIDQHFTPPVD